MKLPRARHTKLLFQLLDASKAHDVITVFRFNLLQSYALSRHDNIFLRFPQIWRINLLNLHLKILCLQPQQHYYKLSSPSGCLTLPTQAEHISWKDKSVDTALWCMWTNAEEDVYPLVSSCEQHVHTCSKSPSTAPARYVYSIQTNPDQNHQTCIILPGLCRCGHMFLHAHTHATHTRHTSINTSIRGNVVSLMYYSEGPSGWL